MFLLQLYSILVIAMTSTERQSYLAKSYMCRIIGWMKQVSLYISVDVTCWFDDVMFYAYTKLQYITKKLFYGYNMNYMSATKLNSYYILPIIRTSHPSLGLHGLSSSSSTALHSPLLEVGLWTTHTLSLVLALQCSHTCNPVCCM